MHALDMVGRITAQDLACAFPPKKFLNGAATTIEDLAHHGLGRANRLFVPDKAAAVRLIVATNYFRPCAYGKGSEAKRRAADLATLKRRASAAFWANVSRVDYEANNANPTQQNLADFDRADRRGVAGC